jgi:hypothetical protein
MILEFLEFSEMERSLSKSEFIQGIKNGIGCHFELCVLCVCQALFHLPTAKAPKMSSKLD